MHREGGVISERELLKTVQDTDQLKIKTDSRCNRKMGTDNITVSNSTKEEPKDVALRITYTISLVIYCVIFVVGTVGNGLVIYVTGFRMKRTVNSVWFLNLALADFFFTAFLVFSIITVSKDHEWQFGLVICKLNSFVTVVNMFASIFLLTAISLDRCLSTCVVVWAQNKRTVLKAQLTSAAIWLMAIACSTPYATFRNLVHHNGKLYCSYPKDTPKRFLDIFRFVMAFLVPFLVITVCYVAIGVRARRLQRTRRHRSRRIIISVILAFFFCWLPFHVFTFIELNFGHDPDLMHTVRIGGTLAVGLGFLNSCLNPILYIFMCDEFQKKLKQSICHVLESALTEDHLSFMSSRSLSSHLSRISRKSDSSLPVERKGTLTSLTFTECRVVNTEERETMSTE